MGWLCFLGEKLKTGIKITQISLKIRLVFLQGVHLPEKITYLQGPCQMGDCDMKSVWKNKNGILDGIC